MQTTTPLTSEGNSGDYISPLVFPVPLTAPTVASRWEASPFVPDFFLEEDHGLNSNTPPSYYLPPPPSAGADPSPSFTTSTQPLTKAQHPEVALPSTRFPTSSQLSEQPCLSTGEDRDGPPSWGESPPPPAVMPSPPSTFSPSSGFRCGMSPQLHDYNQAYYANMRYHCAAASSSRSSRHSQSRRSDSWTSEMSSSSAMSPPAMSVGTLSPPGVSSPGMMTYRGYQETPVF